jgi:hypothetical protein
VCQRVLEVDTSRSEPHTCAQALPRPVSTLVPSRCGRCTLRMGVLSPLSRSVRVSNVPCVVSVTCAQASPRPVSTLVLSRGGCEGCKECC